MERIPEGGVKVRKEVFEGCELYMGDCREFMNTLSENSVDAVVTDPPYLIHAGRGGGAFGGRAHLVNTGGFTEGGCEYDFLEKFRNWFVFCSLKQLRELMDVAATKERFNLITWAKPNPVPTCNNKYLPDVEYIVHGFSKGNLFGEMRDKSSFVLCPSKKETPHPNEKPKNLISKLIASGTLPGQTVFDPFMGSGTTGVSCVELGRKFIGCEIEPKYFDIACKRIDAAARQGKLF